MAASSTFSLGAIYWSPASRRPCRGRCHRRLLGHPRAGRRARSGYPTGDEICGLVRGGCLQTFQHATMYYSPATGAQPVQEPIIAGYRAQGWETGPAGYPLGNQILRARRRRLLPGSTSGAIVCSGAASGAHAVRGALLSAWGARGWEDRAAGLPDR